MKPSVVKNIVSRLRGRSGLSRNLLIGLAVALADAASVAVAGETRNLDRARVGEEAKLSAAGGAPEDFFGVAIALSGDTALVGAPGEDIDGTADRGAAYVFVRDGARWRQQARLTVPEGVEFGQFGISVDLSSDTAVVGSPGAGFEPGRAYVFVRSGEVWTQQASLTASDAEADDLFGLSVAIKGDTVLVGAMFDDIDGEIDQGSAYVFTRNGGNWAQRAKLTPASGAAQDLFGNALALSGDTAVIAAVSDNASGNPFRGTAYVFVNRGGDWQQQAQLTADDGRAFDFASFGNSVALFGDTALLGAPGDDVGNHPDQGVAYVFVRSGPNWTQQQKLTSFKGSEFDNFGNAVALSGDIAVVGERFDVLGGEVERGSAYVFTRRENFWTQRRKLTASDGSELDLFGSSVALSGNRIAVSAPGDFGSASAGAAYIYRVAPKPELAGSVSE